MAFSIEIPGLSLQQKLFLAASSVAILAFYHLYIKPNYVSSIRHIPGPPPSKIISGSMTDIFKAEAAVQHRAWIEKYGPVIKYRGFMGVNRLYVSADSKALNHILLQHAYSYPKPEVTRKAMARILGKGLVFAEAQQHRRQRRLLMPAFTAARCNAYLPIFQKCTDQLIDRMEDMLRYPDKYSVDTKEGDAIMEISELLSKVTLDIIGLAGFDYDFGQMTSKPGEDNELAAVFKKMMKPRDITPAMIIANFLIMWFPILAKAPTATAKAINHSMSVMNNQGREMLDIRMKQAEDGELEEKTDLLSLIVKENLRVPDPKDKLPDDEVMGQISTFILAGHETSATSLTWALYHLSRNPTVQQKLRAEIRDAKAEAKTLGLGSLSADTLNGLPYLDAVIRETMRVEPPVTVTIREAAQDDVIPLAEPLVGTDGREITSIPVKKGQVVMLGLNTFNRTKSIFGEDSDVFRPERWIENDLTGKVRGFATWAPLMSFLGGARGCIGYKFSLLEQRVILADLVDKFEFAPRDPELKIKRQSNIVTRPVVIGEEDKGHQLPLRVRLAAR